MGTTQEQDSNQINTKQSKSSVDKADASALLQEYAAETWDLPDDVPEQAVITRAEEEICRKEIERSLQVTEERIVEEHAPSVHAEFNPDEYFVDAPVEERAEILPTEFVEETFRFFIPGSEEQSNCSQCSSRGRVACGKCSGQGNVKCKSCKGTGTKTDSDGDKIRCRKCNGNGNRPCSSCDGMGDLTCERCDGSGQTIKFEYFQRSFAPTENVEIVSESVPSEFLTEAQGQHRVTDDLPVTGDTVRRESEIRDIPATIVEYEYDDSDYTIFEIEHEIKAATHPRDMKRWGKVVGVIVLSLALAAGVYLFVL